MPFLYIESSIVSYLRQRISGQVVVAARQILTRKWWEDERANYQLVASQYVIDEVSDGDPALADERLKFLNGVSLLELSSDIDAIAEEIMARAILPPTAQLDALHIACTSYHRIDYLLTWNCRHIANARILPRIHEVLDKLGQFIPIICTPEEMIDNGDSGQGIE